MRDAMTGNVFAPSCAPISGRRLTSPAGIRQQTSGRALSLLRGERGFTGPPLFSGCAADVSKNFLCGGFAACFSACEKVWWVGVV